MPKVHCVKAARKDYPECGIKKGDTYYWWKFRFGGKHESKTYPKQSQLTQSEFLSQVYALNERLEDLDASIYIDDPESLSSDLEEMNNGTGIFNMDENIDISVVIGGEEMNLCSDNHEEICHGRGFFDCPMCELIQEKDDEIAELKEQVENLRSQQRRILNG